MRTKNILLVDDDPEDIEFFIMTAEQISDNIHVTAVRTKQQIFPYLEQTVPDILFVDNMIQTDSGVECLREIKSIEKYNSIPVIVYSGSTDGKIIREAFLHGAAGYIVKPHSIRELKTVILHVIQYDWNTDHKLYYANETFRELSNPLTLPDNGY